MGYSKGIVIHVALGVDGQSSFDGISPSMGSRYKPDSQYSHAAYFSNLIYYDINFGPNEAASNNNEDTVHMPLIVSVTNCNGFWT